MNRRGLIGALGALVAAPAIIRPGLLMPVKVQPSPWWRRGFPWEPATHVMVWRQDDGLTRPVSVMTEADFRALYPARWMEKRGGRLTEMVSMLAPDDWAASAWEKAALCEMPPGVHRHMVMVDRYAVPAA